jgi:hypothetical protein
MIFSIGQKLPNIGIYWPLLSPAGISLWGIMWINSGITSNTNLKPMDLATGIFLYLPYKKLKTH